MLDLQRRDGAWPAFVGDSEASLTTALALCALNGTGEFTSTREKAFHWLVEERGREAHWLWRWKFVSFRQACVSPSESGFRLGQEAAGGGSAYFKLAGDLRFADSLLVQLSGFDGFVNHRWRAAEPFALLACVLQPGADTLP